MIARLSLAALVPLALGDYSYDYNVPTMAPTTETAQPTLEVCPVLVGLDASECPLGFLNETYPACNSTGLVLGERCWAIVPGDPDQPPTCGDEPDTDCAYTGPPFDDTQRRRLSVSSGAPGVYAANSTNPTAAPTVTDAPTTTVAPTRAETYAPTRMTEAPSYAPTTDTYAPTQSPTATGAPSTSPTQCVIIQVGADIDGEAAGDQSFKSFALSSSCSRISFGSYLKDVNGTISCHNRVFDYNWE